jgi:hypothetical protein
MVAELQRFTMNRWLDFDEACFELRVGPRALQKMLKNGVLVGYRVPVWRRGHNRMGPWGRWRILDPGHKFAQHIAEARRHLEHVPLLSGREVAEVLGVTPGAIRQLKKRKRLCGVALNHQTLYTAREIRRFLFRREKQGRQSYSPILVRWLRALVAQDEHVAVQVLDEMLSHVVAIPEPEKSRYLVELWWHFDMVNDLVRSARLGDTADSAIEGARSRQRLHSPEVLKASSLSDLANFLSKSLPTSSTFGSAAKGTRT